MGIIGVALATNAQTAKELVITLSCDAGVLVGDFVYESETIDEHVHRATSNLHVPEIIGRVKSKPNATTAKILVVGVSEGFTGLTRGKRLFLGTTGEPTNTPPATGYVQVIGVCLSDTKALIMPNNVRVKRA